MICTIAVPEPFKSAFEKYRPADVVDVEPNSSDGFFARGRARSELGHFAAARADFAKALADYPAPCRLELAYLDLREPGKLADVAATAHKIGGETTRPSLLAARALHIAGLAESKLRNTGAAVGLLLEAAKTYGESGSELGRAHVLDSLGMLQAADGRLDDAVQHFALSIAAKAVLGDRAGIALSLGNMGRAQLQGGRFQQALDCFEADRRIASESGDERAAARLLNDIGRAHQGLGDFEAAEEALRESLKLAEQHGLFEIRFFALKDRVLLLVAAGRLQEADEALAAATQAIPANAEPVLQAYLLFARAVLALAHNQDDALGQLQQSVTAFAQLSLPDAEIAARIELAKALVQKREKREAETCLVEGIGQARKHGFPRFLPVLTEIMTQLDLTAGAAEESGWALSNVAGTLRVPATIEQTQYVVREQLGSGAFGDVFRVYDPSRLQEAALKVLKLGTLYDPAKRTRLINSARTELQVASHIRHPGIVRVLAIGTFEDGRLYVLQELIEGITLRSLIRPEGADDFRFVLSCLADMAFALAALHSSGVVHRDLKPDNVILRDNGQPVLLDFGIAQSIGQITAEEPHVQGTLPYMSPEHLAGKELDGRSDLYALGVLAYEWIAGIRPLRPRGASLVEQIRDLAARRPDPLSTVRPDVPREIDILVMELLAKKPNQRPSTAMQVAGRCQQILASMQSKEGAPETPPKADR